tara:strand:+ start:626 stop:1552 length:927 start_codon:yes stop_codon:yes gene_type:complete
VAELIDRGQSTWGSHRLETFIKCPRRYGYEYEMGLKGDGNKTALIQGILLHTGLAHYYRRIQSIQMGDDPQEWLRPTDAVEAMAEKLAEEHASTEPQTLKDRVCDAITQYHAHWNFDRDWKILAVEEELRIRVKDPERARVIWDDFEDDVVTAEQADGYSAAQLATEPVRYLYTQRPDLAIWHRKFRQVFGVDHKSSARPLRGVAPSYAMSTQFIGYEAIGRAKWGAKWGGTILNGVQITAKRIDFGRPRLPSAPAAMGTFKKTVVFWRRQIADLRRAEIPPEEWPQSWQCYGRYGACPHVARCQGMK